MVVDDKDDNVGKVVTKEWRKAEVLKLDFFLAAEIIQALDSIA